MEPLKNNNGVLGLLISKPSSLENWGQPPIRSVCTRRPDPAASHLDFLAVSEQPDLSPYPPPHQEQDLLLTSGFGPGPEPDRPACVPFTGWTLAYLSGSCQPWFHRGQELWLCRVRIPGV